MSAEDNVVPMRRVTWAAESGTRRDLLVALRDRLWDAFNDKRTQPRDLSPLTLRLKELQAEIDALDEADEPVDQSIDDGEFDANDV